MIQTSKKVELPGGVLIEPIFPMEPKSSDRIPAGTEWAAQIKWDGVRVLAYSSGKEVRLFNRKKHERTLHYPEIADMQAYCRAESVILDGEVIALGADGKPSFHEVMRRDGIRRLERVLHVQKTVPVIYMIFDLLYVNGEWVHRRPLQERSQILSSLIEPNARVQLVSSHADGQALLAAIQQQGMEGIVMKRLDSLYAIGGKKETWLKIKNYRDLIAVIGGCTLSDGIINAILLGLYDEEGKLWYIGHTGTGKLSRKEWRDLTSKLLPQATPERPFVNLPERHQGVQWLQPECTVKIQYAEWTPGRSLRQPSIQGFVDLPPQECRFEQ